MKAKTPCLTRGCYRAAVNHGRCEEHYEPWEGSYRKEELPSDWVARRKIVIRGAGGVCAQCGQDGATDVDHIIPGNNHDLDNLQLLCRSCHDAKTHIEALHGRGIVQAESRRITPSTRVSRLKQGGAEGDPPY